MSRLILVQASSLPTALTGAGSELRLPNIVAAGTSVKVTYNPQGLIVGTAAVTPGDVQSWLGYLPYDNANPAGFVTAAQVAAAGYLTNASIPSKVSQLANDAGYATGSTVTAQINAVSGLIPSKLSQMANDAGFVTATAVGAQITAAVPTRLGQMANDAGFTTATAVSAEIAGVAATVPNKTSQLANDSGFTTATVVAGQIAAAAAAVPTKVSELANDSGYLTQANVAAAAGVPNKVSQLANDTGFITGAALANTLTTSEVDQPAGVAGRGTFGELRYGGVVQGLTLRGVSVAGGAVRLTADGNAATSANSVPVLPLTGGRVAGIYVIKNTANGDVATGDWSCVVSRGASGAPVLGTATGGGLFAPLDTTGSSLASAPLPTLAIDAANDCLLASYPGAAGLSLDVRMVVTQAVVF